MHHPRIGTEHLLLGLMREEQGVASRVLRELGLQSGDVQHWVERLGAAQSHSRSIETDLELTPRTKRVLEIAVDEARRQGNSQIDTHHILLALVRQGDGTALEILSRLGVTGEQVQRYTRKSCNASRLLAAKRRRSRSALVPARPRWSINWPLI